MSLTIWLVPSIIGIFLLRSAELEGNDLRREASHPVIVGLCHCCQFTLYPEAIRQNKANGAPSRGYMPIVRATGSLSLGMVAAGLIIIADYPLTLLVCVRMAAIGSDVASFRESERGVSRRCCGDRRLTPRSDHYPIRLEQAQLLTFFKSSETPKRVIPNDDETSEGNGRILW